MVLKGIKDYHFPCITHGCSLLFLVGILLQVKKKARSTKKKNSKLPQKNTNQPPESAGEATAHDEANAAASTEAEVGPEDANVNVPVLNDVHPEHADTNLGPVEAPAHEEHENELENDEVENDKEEREGEESEEDESEEEEEEMRTKEETLDVHKCVRMFADNTIVNNYCWLLKNYLHNTPAINYYIVRMLQRICEDLMMEPMLYQVNVRS